MEAQIKINMDNDAFKTAGPFNNELSIILRELADHLEERYSNCGISVDVLPILDSNGNRVGELEILP